MKPKNTMSDGEVLSKASIKRHRKCRNLPSAVKLHQEVCQNSGFLGYGISMAGNPFDTFSHKKVSKSLLDL